MRISYQQSAFRILIVIAACCSLPVASVYCQNTVVLQGQPTQEQMQAYNMMQQAMQMLQAKQSANARGLLQQAMQLWPDMPHVHYYLGFANQDTGNYAEAAQEFQKAIQADRQRIDCMINIGTCYQLLGRPADAAEWFERYLKENPSSPKAGQVRALLAPLKKQAARSNTTGGDPSSPDYFGSVAIDGKYRRWPFQQLPLRVFIGNGIDDNGRSIIGFREDYNYALIEALNEWVQATGNRVPYVIDPNPSTANILCYWTDDSSMKNYGGHSAEQGIAMRNEQQMPDGNVAISRAKIVILVQARDGSGPLNSENMRKACLHELGHALGLAGHSMNNQDIMFFSESPVAQPHLSRRDAATIFKLYGDFPAQR